MSRFSCAAFVAFVLLVGSGCSSQGAAQPTTQAAPQSTTPAQRKALKPVNRITALGDSVPYGTACDCSPYPELSGSAVEASVAHAVNVSNDAVAGALSQDVVEQLTDDDSVRTDIERSEVVLVEVGANDVGYSSSCQTTVSCYEVKIPALEHNLATIVDQIRAIDRRHVVRIVLLDYWSVWLGGQYAQAQGQDYVDAASTMTAHVDEAIMSVANKTGATYVDLRRAFKGPSNAWDESHLLAADGDHPNAAGHERIAEAILETAAAA